MRPPLRPHRLKGYQLLHGHGLEIGALNCPAPLPPGCTVEYCDVQSREESVARNPDLILDDLVEVQHLCDLDTEGLARFRDRAFDFVIANHVLEHVANPIRVVGEVFRITRAGGRVVLTVPDKNYACDKSRALTAFDHLLEEYRANVSAVSDAHYLELIEAEHPEMMQRSAEEIRQAVALARSRREHVHVWDSEAFRSFLSASLNVLSIRARCLYESDGADNGFEFFSVWEKTRRGLPALPNVWRWLFARG
ncbi:MAG: methyltransferase domain-containing protein [Candidatus Sumerlaeia bacterium]|nr:methyltransferase domain-containing protein [Candidatus Sumerlaeia bacterium]